MQAFRQSVCGVIIFRQAGLELYVFVLVRLDVVSKTPQIPIVNIANARQENFFANRTDQVKSPRSYERGMSRVVKVKHRKKFIVEMFTIGKICQLFWVADWVWAKPKKKQCIFRPHRKKVIYRINLIK